MKPKISVIIGTYNNLDYLRLCLFALKRQTFKDFEVIVADDGSKSYIGEWVKKYESFFNVTHVWQNDQGFRKCLILNKSVKQSQCDYLVFLDQDCIVSLDFLEQHWKHKEKNFFLCGQRVNLVKELAVRISEEMITQGYFDGFTWWGLFQNLRKKNRYFEEAFRFLSLLRRNTNFNPLGCNFSIFKEDLYKVNGFDEDYVTRGGGEDTDIAMRLRYVGVHMKSVRYRAIQFHLGHDLSEPKTKSERMFFQKKRTASTEQAVSINSSLRL